MFTSPTVTVHLSAIVQNWQTMRAAYTGQEVAAVVKANAYGLGANEVATALAEAGCHTFFVATLDEAITLRQTLPDVRILVFHGVQAGEEFAFRSNRIIPVLNSPEQLARWHPVAREFRDAQSALHLDTAMARLGLTASEWAQLQSTPELFEECRISLILSHLACASDAEDVRNAEQLTRFIAATANIKNIPLSLANSGGILLGAPYHFHLARPGCALYGIHPAGYNSAHTTLQQPATLTAPILQIRTLNSAQQVGYGGTQTLQQNTKIATVACGYADGYLRSISGSGAYGLLRGTRVPLVGRVTMDMLTFDITGINTNEGDRITLLGHDADETITIDQLAQWANTIGYECLTRLGERITRVYA